MIGFIKAVFEKDTSILWATEDDEGDLDDILDEEDTYEVKANCAETLKLLVNNLEKKFAPYIEKSFDIILTQEVWDNESTTMGFIYELCDGLFLYEESIDKRKTYIQRIIPLFKVKIDKLNDDENYDELYQWIQCLQAWFKHFEKANAIS